MHLLILHKEKYHAMRSWSSSNGLSRAHETLNEMTEQNNNNNDNSSKNNNKTVKNPS